MISCLRQVIYVLLCCVLDLQVNSMLTPNLVTTFALLSLLCTMLVHTTNFCATWNFSLSVWSIMVSWVVANGAATKPRASCGRPTQGCAARHALVSRFLVMIHYGIIPMKCFLVTFPLIVSPYHIKRSLRPTRCPRTFFWSQLEVKLWREVTDIKINRLQEVADKWHYFSIPTMTMSI